MGLVVDATHSRLAVTGGAFCCRGRCPTSGMTGTAAIGGLTVDHKSRSGTGCARGRALGRRWLEIREFGEQLSCGNQRSKPPAILALRLGWTWIVVAEGENPAFGIDGERAAHVHVNREKRPLSCELPERVVLRCD